MPHDPKSPHVTPPAGSPAAPKCPSGEVAFWDTTATPPKWTCVAPAAGPTPPPTAQSVMAQELGDPRFAPSFNDQCFLIEKAEKILAALGGPAKLRGTFGAWISAARGGGSEVRQLGQKPLAKYNTNLKYINDITGMVQVKNFFEITPEETARLAHYATISEGLRNPVAKYVKENPIFSSNSMHDFAGDPNLNILRSQGVRTGAGIQNINVTYEGIDAATSKIILVDAQFLFQDIRKMLSAPYNKLFLLSTSEKLPGTKNSKKAGKAFRTIDFEIGWKTTPALTKRLSLNNLKLKLRTHLVKYTFDIRQDGSIVVNAQYRGQIVDVLNGPASNILELAKTSFVAIKNNLAKIEAQHLAAAKKHAKAEKQAAWDVLAAHIIDQVMKKTQRKYGGKDRPMWDWHASLGSQTGNKEQGIELGHLKESLKDIETLSVAHVTGLRGATLIHGDQFSSAEAANLKRLIRDRLNVVKEVLKPSSKATYAEKAAAGKALIGIGKSATASTAAAGAKAKSAQQMARQQATAQVLREAQLARLKALETIGIRLLESGLYYAYVSREKIKNYKVAAAGHDGAAMGTAIASMDASTFLASRKLTAQDINTEDSTGIQVIPFMFLGKLLQTVLDLPTEYKAAPPPPKSSHPASKGLTSGPTLVGKVHELITKTTGETLNIDFGYVSYRGPFSGVGIQNFPLYYLPISLKKINAFFAREIMAKEKHYFSLNNFIKQMLSQFLTNAFNVCTRQSNLEGFIAPKIQYVVGNKDKKLQYFAYGSKNVISDIRGGKVDFGNYNDNFKKKIYHFYLGGQAKGAVRNVKVLDIADETTKTAVYYSNRASHRTNVEGDLAKQGGMPPVVFQADIDTIGFPLFNMGQLIYVDLRPYVTAKSGRHFKANGYYGITKVTHTFSEASFTSKINAIIQFSRADVGAGEKAALGAAPSSGKPVTATAAAPVAGAVASQTKAEIEKIIEERDAQLHEIKWIKEYMTRATSMAGREGYGTGGMSGAGHIIGQNAKKVGQIIIDDEPGKDTVEKFLKMEDYPGYKPPHAAQVVQQNKIAAYLQEYQKFAMALGAGKKDVDCNTVHSHPCKTHKGLQPSDIDKFLAQKAAGYPRDAAIQFYYYCFGKDEHRKISKLLSHGPFGVGSGGLICPSGTPGYGK